MNDNTFQRESLKAMRMALTEPERADYWHGYRHGLRRRYLGDRSGMRATINYGWPAQRATMPCAPLVVADTWTPSRSRTGPTRAAVRLESVPPAALCCAAP